MQLAKKYNSTSHRFGQEGFEGYAFELTYAKSRS